MISFKFVGFVIDDGMRDDGPDLVLATSGLAIDVLAIEVPFPLQMVYNFSPRLSRMPTNNFLVCNGSTPDGDKHSTMHNNYRAFCFVS